MSNMTDATNDRAILRELVMQYNEIAATRGCPVHIHLKDMEILQGDPSRLARWVKIAREVSES